MNHIEQKFDFAQVLLRILQIKKIFDPRKTTSPDIIDDSYVATTRSYGIVLQNKIKQWNIQKDTLENNIYKAYNLVWGQFLYRLKSKLIVFNDYATIHKYFNIFQLMKHTRTIIFKHTEQDY